VVNVLVYIKHHSADLCGFKWRLLQSASEPHYTFHSWGSATSQTV